MQNFSFYMPVRVFFGKGEIAKMGDALKSNGAKSVMIAFGGGSAKKNGVFDAVVG